MENDVILLSNSETHYGVYNKLGLKSHRQSC